MYECNRSVLPYNLIWTWSVVGLYAIIDSILERHRLHCSNRGIFSAANLVITTPTRFLKFLVCTPINGLCHYFAIDSVLKIQTYVNKNRVHSMRTTWISRSSSFRKHTRIVYNSQVLKRVLLCGSWITGCLRVSTWDRITANRSYFNKIDGGPYLWATYMSIKTG